MALAHERQDNPPTANPTDPTANPTDSSSKPLSKPRRPRKRRYYPYQAGNEFYLRSIPLRFYRNLKDREKHKISLKLQARYSGPHIVLEVINPIIFLCNVNGKLRRIHAHRMKRGPTFRRHPINPRLLPDDDHIDPEILAPNFPLHPDMDDDLETDISSYC